MKPSTLLLAAAPCFAREWVTCGDNEWAYKGKCKELVGFAADHVNLPQEAIEFSITFYSDLQTRSRVFKLNNLLRNDLKHAIAHQSMRKNKGLSNCLKNVTNQQLDTIRHVANDDFYHDYDYGTQRIDYGEMYLENLFHLLFKADCKTRENLQKRLDKLLKRLAKHCSKQCRTFGFDYFYHVVDDSPLDYVQSYFDIHNAHEDALGHEILSLNK